VWSPFLGFLLVLVKLESSKIRVCHAG
jgi:hypothetical protein